MINNRLFPQIGLHRATKWTIEPGEWTVELDVHRILPPGSVDYQINVFCENDVTYSKAPMPVPMRPTSVRRRGPGWYTGDLHGHTYHSDGDFSP